MLVMENEEGFVASLKALFVRYGLTIRKCVDLDEMPWYYLEDIEGTCYSIANFLDAAIDKV